MSVVLSSAKSVSCKADSLASRMQREMAFGLEQIVRPAYDAGKAAGDRAVASQDFRFQKIMNRQREEQKRQLDQMRGRIEESLRERVCGMAEELNEQVRIFERSTDEFRKVRERLESKLKDSVDVAVKVQERVSELQAANLDERQKRIEKEGAIQSLSRQIEELCDALDVADKNAGRPSCDPAISERAVARSCDILAGFCVIL